MVLYINLQYSILILLIIYTLAMRSLGVHHMYLQWVLLGSLYHWPRSEAYCLYGVWIIIYDLCECYVSSVVSIFMSHIYFLFIVRGLFKWRWFFLEMTIVLLLVGLNSCHRQLLSDSVSNLYCISSYILLMFLLLLYIIIHLHTVRIWCYILHYFQMRSSINQSLFRYAQNIHNKIVNNCL